MVKASTILIFGGIGVVIVSVFSLERSGINMFPGIALFIGLTSMFIGWTMFRADMARFGEEIAKRLRLP